MQQTMFCDDTVSFNNVIFKQNNKHPKIILVSDYIKFVEIVGMGQEAQKCQIAIFFNIFFFVRRNRGNHVGKVIFS